MPGASVADRAIRAAAFDWLAEQVERHGETLSWRLLRRGFTVGGQRVPLLTQRGIFRPRVLPEIPLSITTSPKNPYGDTFGPDGYLRYRYQGTRPGHPDNAGLRRAMTLEAPLVYLHGLVKGQYLPIWPALIVGDDPRSLTFTVAVDDAAIWSERLRGAGEGLLVRDRGEELRRAYVTTSARRRLHQHAFRARVLDAYRARCALCRLRHVELLDAAHIVPDPQPEGEPVVANGLALCKLHHAAFDRFFLTVRPDYRVEVNHAILDEEDGPMLRHGLQGLHGERIHVPRAPHLKPDRERLARRYHRFKSREAG